MDKKKAALFGGGILGGLLVVGNAQKIIKGIGVGIVAILVSFLLIWNSVNVRETSAEVENLSLQSVSEAQEERGLGKVFGELSTEDPLCIEILRCEQTICTDPEIAFEAENLIYIDVEYQRFEVVRDVEESEESGDRVSETVTYENEWVTYDEETNWADVTIDGVNLNIDDARTIIERQSETVEDIVIEGLPALQTYDRTPESDEPAFGTTRAVVTYITQDDREYTVVGEMRSDGLSSGDPFIVTDNSDSELVSQLGGEESTTRWVLRFISFLLMTFGFTSMLSPILVFTDMIPVAGKAARSLATLVSAILAGVIVLLTTFLLNFWWLILLVVVLGIVAFGLYTYQQQKDKPEAELIAKDTGKDKAEVQEKLAESENEKE